MKDWTGVRDHRDVFLEGSFEFQVTDNLATQSKTDFLRQYIEGEISLCDACGLATMEHHLNKVPATGTHLSPIMFIGEGPGEDENKEGAPFVGKAGQLLNRLFDRAKIKREEVYISNIMKCRPPENRNPSSEEASACGIYIEAEIKMVQPKVIVLLGGIALGHFFPGEKIMKNRGVVHEIMGIPTIPTLHPAFLLRQSGEDYKTHAWNLWNDIQLAYRYIKETTP